MGTLLTEAELREVRDSIKLVTDQFFVTPVLYRRHVESLDRFNEDRRDRLGTPIELRALVEYPSGGSDWAKELQQGSIDSAHIKVTLNYEDLISVRMVPEFSNDFNDTDYTHDKTVGLVDNEEKVHKMQAGSDEFYTQGETYKVVYAGYDGPLDRQNVLVILYGEKRLDGSKPIILNHG